MIREENIVHQSGNYWVLKAADTRSYEVRKDVGLVSETHSAYPLTEDGLSLAVACCDFQAERASC